MKNGTILAGMFTLSLLVWITVSVTGGGEAWDRPGYWSAGLPAIYLGALAAGWVGPPMALRLGIASALGQFVGLLAAAADWSLWPLGMIMLIMLSVPVPLAASLGGVLRARFER